MRTVLLEVRSLEETLSDVADAMRAGRAEDPCAHVAATVTPLPS